MASSTAPGFPIWAGESSSRALRSSSLSLEVVTTGARPSQRGTTRYATPPSAAATASATSQ